MKSRIAITLVAMMAGLLVLFYGDRIPEVREFDAAAIHLYSFADEMAHDDRLEEGIVGFRPLIDQEDVDRKFQLVAITDDPDRIFEKSPPSPLDYAVILDALHERGEKPVVLATRIAWDDYTEMELQALDGRLALFEHAIIPLPVTRGATKKSLPASLERSLIPFSNIKGNYQLFPVVNQVTLSNHANGAEQTYAGFSRIESELSPESSQIQMLAQWSDEGVIPSLELLILMSEHSIMPDDLIIQCGKSIRLGNDGPIIPLDEFGRASITSELETNDATSIKSIKAESLMESSAEQKTNTYTSIIQATGEKVLTSNSFSPERLSSLLAMSTYFPIPIDGIEFTRIPLWIEVALILDLCIFIYIGLCLRGITRQLVFISLAITVFTLLMAIMHTMNGWLHLSPLFTVILTVWLLSFLLRRKKA